MKPAAAEMLESVRSLTDSGLTSVINFDVKAPLDKYQEQLTALSTQLGAAVGNQRRAIANAMSLLERLTGQFKTQRLID
ncbi:MAG TPA: hypothetical protein VNZ25_10225, partial [Candidatus Angelobacter sp.]|nr:hypothetical protein [Candidatus Angelobacter sp.]